MLCAASTALLSLAARKGSIRTCNCWSKQFLEGGKKRFAGDTSTWTTQRGLDRSSKGPHHRLTRSDRSCRNYDLERKLGLPFHEHHRATPNVCHRPLQRDDNHHPELGHGARLRPGAHRRCRARLTLTGSSGRSLSLADFKGKTVMLEHYRGNNMQALPKKWTGQGVVCCR